MVAQKSVLITGCSEGGIGDALAKEFHQKGLRVFATARDLTKVEHLKALGITDVFALDVVDEAAIARAVQTVEAATGGTLDILVNNSGAGYSSPMMDTEVAVAKKMFDVNVFALVSVSQAFAPLLIASKKGVIVNIGSVAGEFPLPWQGYYNASKAAVKMLTAMLRIELAPFGVTAINVITGGIKTNFYANVPTRELKKGSMYEPATEEILYLANGGIIDDGGMEVDEYAKIVVANALKSSPNVNQWVGQGVWTVWAGTLMWGTFWDTLVSYYPEFKFPAIMKKIKESRKIEMTVI